MQLDDTQYLRDVVDPLAKGKRSDEDLDFVYLVQDSMSEREIVETVHGVESIWSRRGTGRGRTALKVSALQRSVPLHVEKLAASLGVPGGRSAHHSEAFWGRYHASTAADHQKAADALATTLRLQYGGIGAVTRDRVQAMAEAFPQYQALPERTLVDAVKKAGLVLVDAVDLPEGAPDVSAPKDLLRQLEESKVPSIYHAVFPTLEKFRVVKGFRGLTAEGDHVTIGVETIDKRARAVKRGDINDHTLTALDHLLGLLATSGRQGKDLDHLFFTVFIRGLEARMAAGQVALLTELFGLGLDRIEAARIVLSLDPEAGSLRAGEVASALADGELRSARRLLGALPRSTPGLADLEARVRAAEVAVDSVAAEARSALAAGDLARAAACFSAAASRAIDDEQLAAEIAALPPGAPTQLAAAVEYGRDSPWVTVIWSPGPLTPVDATYMVVSRTDRTPLHPGDGDGVEVHSTRTGVTAGAPGTTLHLAVFAKGENAWSRGAATTVDIAPPITGLALQGRDGSVRGTWAHPAAARQVRVHRDGHEVRLEGPGVFQETGLDAGTRFTYTVQADYRLPDGRMVSSPVVSAAIQPLKDVGPLPALDVRADPGSRDGSILVEWLSPGRAPVLVLRSREEPSVRFGTVIPEERLTALGERLVGTVRQLPGGRHSLKVLLPAGSWHLSAFSLGPDGYVAGARTETMVIPGIDRVEAQRAGSEVRLTWDWPDGIHHAQVDWQAADVAGTITVDRHTLLVDGGCRLRSGPGPLDVTITAIHDQGGRRWSSAPFRSHLPGAAATCAYSVRHAVVGNKVTLTFRHESGGDLRGDVEVVARTGQTMPLGREGTTVLGTVRLNLPAGAETAHDFTVPRHLRKPLWVCAFAGAEAGFTLHPATTKGMKK